MNEMAVAIAQKINTNPQVLLAIHSIPAPESTRCFATFDIQTLMQNAENLAHDPHYRTLLAE